MNCGGTTLYRPQAVPLILTAIVQIIFNNTGAIAGRGSYTEGIWPFHIVDLNCTGSEGTIWECPHNGLYGVYTCGHTNDASVICQGLCGL